jgi:hypothetical protein
MRTLPFLGVAGYPGQQEEDQMTSASGQSRERFPQAPRLCAERGERVPVFVAWDQDGWTIEHPGLDPFFLSLQETTGDYWPIRALLAFAVQHAASDVLDRLGPEQREALVDALEEAPEVQTTPEPTSAPEIPPEPSSDDSEPPAPPRRYRRLRRRPDGT